MKASIPIASCSNAAGISQKLRKRIAASSPAMPRASNKNACTAISATNRHSSSASGSYTTTGDLPTSTQAFPPACSLKTGPGSQPPRYSANTTKQSARSPHAFLRPPAIPNGPRSINETGAELEAPMPKKIWILLALLGVAACNNNNSTGGVITPTPTPIPTATTTTITALYKGAALTSQPIMEYNTNGSTTNPQ